MENVDNLITFVMLIKDRAAYTVRWMQYANSTHFPFEVLIADGGADKQLENCLKDKNSYPNVNYQYLRYPFDGTRELFYKKTVDVLYRVKTPYVAFIDDDDFIAVEAVRASIKFLESNPDYSVCRGKNLAFFLDRKDKKPFFQFQPLHFLDISNNSAVDRLRKVQPYFSGTFYDVHRTTNYQFIFEKVAEINIHFLNMIEMLVAYMDAAMGKIKRLNQLYLFREFGHGQSTSDKVDHLTSLLTGPSSENLEKICRVVATEVSKSESVDIEVLAKQLHRDFLRFYVPTLSNQLYAHYDIPFKRVLQNLRTWLIRAIQKTNKRIAKLLRSSSELMMRRKKSKELGAYIRANQHEKKLLSDMQIFLKDYKVSKEFES